MKNYVQPGQVRAWINGTGLDVVSGQVVVVGQQLGIATVDIADGATGNVAFEGVFTVPKVAGAVIADGETVLWDASAGEFDDKAAIAAAGDVSNAASAVGAYGGGVTSMQVQLANRIGTVT